MITHAFQVLSGVIMFELTDLLGRLRLLEGSETVHGGLKESVIDDQDLRHLLVFVCKVLLINLEDHHLSLLRRLQRARGGRDIDPTAATLEVLRSTQGQRWDAPDRKWNVAHSTIGSEGIRIDC